MEEINIVRTIRHNALYLRERASKGECNEMERLRLASAIEDIELWARRLEEKEVKEMIFAYLRLNSYECLYAYISGIYHSFLYEEKKGVFKE